MQSLIAIMWFLPLCVELSEGCVTSSPRFTTVYSTVWNYDSTERRDLMTCTQSHGLYSHCSTPALMWTKFRCLAVLLPLWLIKGRCSSPTHLSWSNPGQGEVQCRPGPTSDLLKPAPAPETTHALLSDSHGWPTAGRAGFVVIKQGDQVGLMTATILIEDYPNNKY